MILDTLANRHLYQHLGERIQMALAYLANTDIDALARGTYHIDGDNIFAIVNDYQTQQPQSSPFEAHQRYIDVQYVAQGQELCGYLPLATQTPSQAYNTERDFCQFDYASNAADASFVQLKAGIFAIFFPTDIHMPGVSEQPQQVRKVVVKVKVAE